MFADLLVSASPSLPDNIGDDPVIPDGTVTEWLVEGFGVITCEPNGILNLNRHLPVALGEVHLARQFELPSGGPVEIALGFSDELTLQLDEQVIFEGQQTFANLPEYAARGYVDANQHCVRQILAPGVHTLAACLKVTESFGWGLILSLQGEQIQLLPV
jgi:hypothetical protein